ncbi:sigma-E factor regulatory protein RseB domain-containing protein [Nakamurella endophytica]|nr:sigma-E factor regulatory protein RseB domain-containing protein [Nakamurella endophytica]
MAQGSGAARRWALVTGLVAVLVALPVVIGAWPAPDADRSAAELRAAALSSTDVDFSGYAESAGGLALPATDQLGSVADLFSSRTRMRVWWRGPADNRVDVLTPAGETDVHQDTDGRWTWDFEADRAVRDVSAGGLALPAAGDLLPTTLARRLLSEARPAELSRAGADRVAGRDALALRVVPADAAASVARVDVWVDAGSGLPLQVQVWGKGAGRPAVDTRFLDVALGDPGAAVTAFAPPADARVRAGSGDDVLDEAGRRLSSVSFPGTLAGLPRRTVAGAPPAVGLYGRGVTLLAVVPLPYGVAVDLSRAAAADPDAVRDQLGVRLTAGPLGILLAGDSGVPAYLLTGTVTTDALAQAARALPGLAAA